MLQKKLRSLLKRVFLLLLMPVSLSACTAPEQPAVQPGTEVPSKTMPPQQGAAWSDYMITYTETEWPAGQMRRALFAKCSKEISALMKNALVRRRQGMPRSLTLKIRMCRSSAFHLMQTCRSRHTAL